VTWLGKRQNDSASLCPPPITKALKALAEAHRPPLTLQYLVEYGIGLLLAKAENPQLSFDFGDPFAKGAR